MTTATYRVNEEQTSNGGKPAIDLTIPYTVAITIEGVAPLLMNAWNSESVAAKAAAAKNSVAKKTDDIESKVYRLPDGRIGIPGANFVRTIVESGRYMPDPRSPRKSAMDLCKAGVVPLTALAPFEPDTREWDYEDKQRVVVQRSAVTRTRPAMREGWRLTFDLLINTPEYLSPTIVQNLINQAGRLIGLCDFRPSYGRFNVVNFEVRKG